MHVPNWCLEVYNTRPTPIMMIHSVMSNIGLNFQVLERMGFIASVSCWALSLSLYIYIFGWTPFLSQKCLARISFVQLFCVCFLLSPHVVKGIKSQPLSCSLPSCMYHWTLFFCLPKNAWLAKDFICPTLLYLFLCLQVWWKEASRSLRVPVCQLSTIELFFSLPKNASLATIWLVQLFCVCLFVCLFVSAHCGRDEVTASLFACCQACTISLTKCCFLLAICVSSLMWTLTRAVTKLVPFMGSSFVWELTLVRTRNLHTHYW